ncbi:hypothetical protein EJ06DRAFT_415447 [Trichodelitschia bisporula]|uniref:DUF1349-domain-containing protein n=1 Tax=Trichodelitschia bisporula TaxID=703511 RepID=A0A6G1HZ08_9PEZI|nr:hypothetical protein EJ06DRAFT_415447 [Trichodelitschia bisporula]
MPRVSPDRASFNALNLPSAAIPEWMGSFILSAPPNTDLWRKPPAADTSTAPILYTALRNPFVSAEVTVSADWRLEWDQAGLVIFAGNPPGRTPSPPTAAQQQHAAQQQATNPSAVPPPAYNHAPAAKWVKLGLEFTNSTCHASSVVATADGADWCVTTLPRSQASRAELRVKMERIGHALWLYYKEETTSSGSDTASSTPPPPGSNGGWKKLREVTWFFYGVEDKNVRVGVYASRPANFAPSMWESRNGGQSITQSNLRVEFEDLEIF